MFGTVDDKVLLFQAIPLLNFILYSRFVFLIIKISLQLLKDSVDQVPLETSKNSTLLISARAERYGYNY